MLSKQKYLIRISQKASWVQNGDKEINFKFSDENGRSTIVFESQIGDFASFETQLSIQLGKLNYKTWPWIRNIMYFVIPNNLNQVQMRSYFDSADHVDSNESYLLKENIALQLSPKYQNSQKEMTCFVGVYESKIEFSVMLDLEFKFLKTLHADYEVMCHVENMEDIIEVNLKQINAQFSIKNYYLLTNIENTTFNKNESMKNFDLILNVEELIKAGLENASINEVKQLYNRTRI